MATDYEERYAQQEEQRRQAVEIATERERLGWSALKSFIWAAALVLVVTVAATSGYCANRDVNADALALCLQSNSAVECAGLFDSVDVEISR